MGRLGTATKQHKAPKASCEQDRQHPTAPAFLQQQQRHCTASNTASTHQRRGPAAAHCRSPGPRTAAAPPAARVVLPATPRSAAPAAAAPCCSPRPGQRPLRNRVAGSYIDRWESERDSRLMPHAPSASRAHPKTEQRPSQAAQHPVPTLRVAPAHPAAPGAAAHSRRPGSRAHAAPGPAPPSAPPAHPTAPAAVQWGPESTDGHSHREGKWRLCANGDKAAAAVGVNPLCRLQQLGRLWPAAQHMMAH